MTREEDIMYECELDEQLSNIEYCCKICGTLIDNDVFFNPKTAGQEHLDCIKTFAIKNYDLNQEEINELEDLSEMSYEDIQKATSCNILEDLCERN